MFMMLNEALNIALQMILHWDKKGGSTSYRKSFKEI